MVGNKWQVGGQGSAEGGHPSLKVGTLMTGIGERVHGRETKGSIFGHVKYLWDIPAKCLVADMPQALCRRILHMLSNLTETPPTGVFTLTLILR